MDNVFKVDVDAAVREFADTVYRLAVINTNTVADAEDAFQEVFVRLVKNKDKIESKEHLKAWLIRVTINECRRITGSSWKKNVTLASSDADDEDLDTPLDIAVYTEDGSGGVSSGGNPENGVLEEVIREEEAGSVMEAVQKLPEKYREVVHLYYYEEMKIPEIAQTLETNDSTVKTRLKRAREALSQLLKGGARL
ncbi:MAG: sigma-70 family RNA polymerase sigma factor [Eubacterium sp.]|nr:sigma-70 family RNA polymerase sigma factor [Eubacterium sp.]